MNRDTPRSEVVNPQHTADDVSAHVVEHKDLPYRLAILVQYGGGVRNEAVGGGRIMVRLCRMVGIMVQVEDLLDRGCKLVSARGPDGTREPSTTYRPGGPEATWDATPWQLAASALGNQAELMQMHRFMTWKSTPQRMWSPAAFRRGVACRVGQQSPCRPASPSTWHPEVLCRADISQPNGTNTGARSIT